jgi:hypothetical protein
MLDELRLQAGDVYIAVFEKLVGQYDSLGITDTGEYEKFAEELIREFSKERYNFDGHYLSQAIKLINESVLLKNVRKIYAAHNIKLKTHHTVDITFRTECCQLTLTRYMMTPKTHEDANRLMDLEGKRTVYPLDMALGLDKLPHRMTINAMLKVAAIATESSYDSASEILARNHNFKIDLATAMYVTNNIGEIALQSQMDRANFTYDKYFGTNPVTIDTPLEKRGGILYIELDGGFVYAREKSKEQKSCAHDTMHGLVFSADHKCPVKEYTSYVGDEDIFKKLIFDSAIRNGYGKFKETVLISDGSPWIKKIKEEVFGDAVEILDYFVLSQKLTNFGKRYFNIKVGHNSHDPHNIEDAKIMNHPHYPQFKLWYEDMHLRLIHGRQNEVIDTILLQETSNRIKNNSLSKFLVYNKDNIDYATYIKKGYDISCGDTAGKNKSALKKRLEEPRKHWHLESAQNIAMLKSKSISSRWHEDVVIPVRDYYKIKN